MSRLIASILPLLALLLALNNAQRTARAQEIGACVYERTGPTDGISQAEALVICQSETPRY